MSEKAHNAHAGAPAHPEQHQPHGAAAGSVGHGPPTPAQLDERERHKTGPRREAGPPLEGGAPHPAAAPGHPEPPPDPTDPKK